MADKRAFATFDVGYLDNPKIADVFDASPIAVCMHFASVLYCAQHLTDGFIALRTLQRKAGGTEDDTRLLINAGLWHEAGHDCEWCPEVPNGKLYVHDYTQHNRTSEGVKGRSTVARDNANARWEKKRREQEKADANGNASRNANGDDSQCLDRQTDRQTENLSSAPESKKQPSKRKTQAPSSMEVTPEMRAWARDNDITTDLKIETAQFLDHHASKGSTFLDWKRAWQTWMRNSMKYASPSPAAPSTGFDPRNWMNQ